MSFEFTDNEIWINTVVSAVAAGVSIGMSLFILIAAFVIYKHEEARHLLDRVSFRLLLWSMAFEIFYDIFYIPTEMGFLVDNGACAAGVYIFVANLGVVNYLCTCIAINLMLTVCFGINPVKMRLERWYVGVSIVLGFGVPLAPVALGHFGWDPVLEVCWIQAGNNETRMRNLILDLYLWQILSCLVASVAVLTTLIVLFRSGKATSRALFQNHIVHEPSFSAVDDLLSPGRGKSIGHWAECKQRRKARRESRASSVSLGQLEERFMKIALKISLYPISLIIVNGVITVGDLYISKLGGVPNRAVYVLYCIYYFLYGGRGIVFAALGIFVDPTIGRGLSAVFYIRRQRKHASPIDPEKPGNTHSFREMLELPTPDLEYKINRTGVRSEPALILNRPSIDRRESSKSIELNQALSFLPIEAVTLGVRLPFTEEHRHSRDITKSFTRSFNGVESDALPLGLTDEVDVEVTKRREVRLQSVQSDVWRGLGIHGVMVDNGEVVEGLAKPGHGRNEAEDIQRRKRDLEKTFEAVHALL